MVYAGVDATAPLRATVCGSASTTVSVPGTDAYVVFVTGSGNAGSLDGFTASYTLTTATPCASSVTLTDPASAVLTDGYAAVGYAAGLACDFIVAPSSPLGAITLNFERFELGPNDIVHTHTRLFVCPDIHSLSLSLALCVISDFDLLWRIALKRHTAGYADGRGLGRVSEQQPQHRL